MSQDKMSPRQIVLRTKYPSDKMTPRQNIPRQNIPRTKCPLDKMTPRQNIRRQNIPQTKCPIDKMSHRQYLYYIYYDLVAPLWLLRICQADMLDHWWNPYSFILRGIWCVSSKRWFFLFWRQYNELLSKQSEKDPYKEE